MPRKITLEQAKNIIKSFEEDKKIKYQYLDRRSKAIRDGTIDSMLSRLEHHLLTPESYSYDTNHHEYRLFDRDLIHVADAEFITGLTDQPYKQFGLSFTRAENNNVKYIIIHRLKICGDRIITLADTRAIGRSKIMSWDEYYNFMNNLSTKTLEKFGGDSVKFRPDKDTGKMIFIWTGDTENWINERRYLY